VQRSLLAGFLSLPLSFSASLDFSPLLSQIEVSRVKIAAVSCVQGDFKLRDLTRAFF
jgi:hypothetical protein